jgi:large subunit ribosomal protein L9
MKVILLQDSKELGKKGAVVNVADGYARNFLIPRQIVLEANESNMKSLKEDQRLKDAKAKRLLDEAKAAADMLRNKTVTVISKAGDSGRLFGSVTPKDVADAIKKQYKVDVDRRKIEIQESVKTIGLYEALLSLHQEAHVAINLRVVAEEDHS